MTVYAGTPVKFIYLNGSNANTAKDKVAFTNGINNAHIYIKNTLEGSDFVRQNMLQNGNIFFLTVNFADDPLGFPVSKNYSADEMAGLNNLTFTENGRGFTYNKSDVKSPAPFISANCSYWRYPKKFTKLIRDAYIEGYKNFYPSDN